MEEPDGCIPENFNWADYCEALWTECFAQSILKRKPSQSKEFRADYVKPAKSHFNIRTLDKSNWAEYCDALRNECHARSMLDRRF